MIDKALRIVSVTSSEEFESLREPWNALLSAATSNNFFLTWEWQYSWWQTYGRRGALMVLLAYDADGCLCGVAPLYRTATYVGPLRFRTLEFIGGRHVASEYLDFIVRAGDHAQVVTSFLAELRRRGHWELIVGHHTAEESPTLSAFDSGAVPWTISGRTESLYVPAGLEWEAYLNTLGKHTRKNVRYYRRGVENKLGAVLSDARDDLPTRLHELAALHQMRMQQLGFPGSFASSRFLAFHERVATLVEGTGWGRFFALRTPERTIAAIYGFEYNGTFSDYSVGFDPAFKDHSVGFVLWSHMIEQCMQSGLEVDFLDPGQFKELWNPQRRCKVSFVVGASERTLSAYRRASATRLYMVSTVKQLLPVEAAARITAWKDSFLSRLS